MSNSGRKSKGGLSAVFWSAVRTQYTRAIRQITRAALPYIYRNYWFSNVTKIMHTACPVLVHNPVQYDIHTICDVEIFVVQLTH